MLFHLHNNENRKLGHNERKLLCPLPGSCNENENEKWKQNKVLFSVTTKTKKEFWKLKSTVSWKAARRKLIMDECVEVRCEYKSEHSPEKMRFHHSNWSRRWWDFHENWFSFADEISEQSSIFVAWLRFQIWLMVGDFIGDVCVTRSIFRGFSENSSKARDF